MMMYIQFKNDDAIDLLIAKGTKALIDGMALASLLAPDKKAEAWFWIAEGKDNMEGKWCVFFGIKWSDMKPEDVKAQTCFYPFPSKEKAADYAIAVAEGIKKGGPSTFAGMMETRTEDVGLKESTTEVQEMLKQKGPRE